MAFAEEQNETIRNDPLRETRHCGVTIGMRETSAEQPTETVAPWRKAGYSPKAALHRLPPRSVV